MKTRLPSIFLFLLFLYACGGSSTPELTDEEIKADSTGLAGDHFSLEGALELFKTAGSPEAFEQALNTEDNHVNNLDLNADGQTDYIRVIDNMENEVHAIVLQAVLGDQEAQDVAVIGIEKTAEDSAFLQIAGDVELYGDSGIVEPLAEMSQGGIQAASFGFIAKKGVSLNVSVNVMLWPCVAFIYAPAYTIWVSPWHWGHYPPYWKAWKPHPWHVHYKHSKHYFKGYGKAHKHSIHAAHALYGPHRKSSGLWKNHYKSSGARFKQVGGHKPDGKQDGMKSKKKQDLFGKQGKDQKSNTKPLGGGNKQGGKKETNIKLPKGGKQGDGGGKKKGK
ncbi:MAG: hypothetical protein AB1458_13685 [Bacteroidota bacterium]